MNCDASCLLSPLCSIAVVKANHDKVKKDIIHVVFHIRDLHGVVDPADGMRAEEIVSTYETVLYFLLLFLRKGLCKKFYS